MILALLLAASAPVHCDNCAAWNEPREPFRVFGNTYWVGVHGLGAVLVTSGQGHVLIDGALPQSADLIAASIKALGFRVEDVKLILASHAHFDHVGGIADLAQRSGARVAASAPNAAALESGKPHPDDPQARTWPFPRVAKVQRVKDGETLQGITAHLTPGHTPGSTTWTWRSCEGARCLNVVYADSVNAISDDGYRFSDHASYVAAFRAGLAKLAALPCDVLLAVHPNLASVDEKREAQKKGNADAFVDKDACAAYAKAGAARLDQRLAQEKTAQ